MEKSKVKAKLKELNDYFVNKLVNADYVIKVIETHTITVIVDEEYLFRLWTANGTESLQLYAMSFDIPPIGLTFTEGEKVKIKASFDNAIKSKEAIDKENEERKELDRLKAKFGE